MDTTLKKLITKYGIIILLNSIFGYLWFRISHLFFNPVMTDITKQNLFYSLPSYLSYFIQLIVCILLILDIRKYAIRFWLIPVIGLFYPVFGVAVFLILYITQQRQPENFQKSDR